MSAPETEAVDERLAIFEDEADINDWIEVMCGAAMVLLGFFHMFSPGELVDPDTMRDRAAGNREGRIGRCWFQLWECSGH